MINLHFYILIYVFCRGLHPRSDVKKKIKHVSSWERFNALFHKPQRESRICVDTSVAVGCIKGLI